ncbi:MAG: DUF4260 domain-containing protein [Lactobacillales bacterium]|nr:DUF4260 domain-containing protein [Lactobacillales bacterium]
MKKLLVIENIFLLILTLYIYFFVFRFSILVLILGVWLPDLSMLGYFKDNKFGAYLYNSVHNLILPSFLAFVGVQFQMEIFIYVSLILFIHIFLDRMLGYGLKYTDDFKHTHCL